MTPIAAVPAARAIARSCVVSPIITVRSTGDIELVGQFEEHRRMRLRVRLVGTARCGEEHAQSGRAECAVESAAALAGRHRQRGAAFGQFHQQFAHAAEEHDLRLAREVVVAIAGR